MKKIHRVFAMLMAAIMALSLVTTAFAAEPTIDPAKKASLSIYKYDITKASEDGVWDAESYLSTGLHDNAVVDMVTLVTCTPFGVNTHRLLVRGHRIPYTPEQEATAAAEKPAASSWTQHYLTGLGIGLAAVAVVGGGYFFVRRVHHA